MLFSLPIAPSSNNAFLNRKRGIGYGRIKSQGHRAWIKQADAHYVLQHLDKETPVKGRYRCTMVFPEHTRGDIDGRSKLILDWMVSRGLTPDDRYCRSLHSDYGNCPDGLVRIEVLPHGDVQGPTP